MSCCIIISTTIIIIIIITILLLLYLCGRRRRGSQAGGWEREGVVDNRGIIFFGFLLTVKEVLQFFITCFVDLKVVKHQVEGRECYCRASCFFSRIAAY
jgi:hypothetical protein